MYEGQKVVALIDGTGERGRQALWPLGERPILWHLITRLKTAPTVDEILVLIDEQEQELPALLEWMNEENLRVYRSSGGDLLERAYEALLDEKPPQVVVSVAVNQPLFSPTYLEKMIAHLIDAGLDALESSPAATGITAGLATQVMRYQALVDAHLLALASQMRQELTRFVLERPQAFRVSTLQPHHSLCSEIRLLVEDEEDLEQMRQIYRALYRPGEIIDCTRVVEWLGRRAVA